MPILDAALAWVVCDLRDLIPTGDHEIAIGEIVAMDLADGDPLLWSRGGYRSLPEDTRRSRRRPAVR